MGFLGIAKDASPGFQGFCHGSYALFEHSEDSVGDLLTEITGRNRGNQPRCRLRGGGCHLLRLLRQPGFRLEVQFKLFVFEPGTGERFRSELVQHSADLSINFEWIMHRACLGVD